ncbi:MAG: hypothetical protein E6G97_18490 [Alphaproteobacteria bacterium]|nr:MAG: hypothetical protein E6G97_18490 [Alphaproteobacteria bacterium]
MTGTVDPSLRVLLESCGEEPGEAVHRLALADWLEEMGGRDLPAVLRKEASPDHKGPRLALVPFVASMSGPSVSSKKTVVSVRCAYQAFLFLAGELFRFLPVADVNLYDWRPVGFHDLFMSGDRWVLNQPRGLVGEPDALIWEDLIRAAGASVDAVMATSWVFDDRVKAMVCRSLACLYYGRRVAGRLPVTYPNAILPMLLEIYRGE